MQVGQKRGVVLVDQYHHLAAGLLADCPDEVAKTYAVPQFTCCHTVFFLVLPQHIANVAHHTSGVHILATAHIEPENRILDPVFFQRVDFQVGKQLPLRLKVALKRIDKQRLAETARTGQEHELTVPHHLVHPLGFVNIGETVAYDVFEVLPSYRIRAKHVCFT